VIFLRLQGDDWIRAGHERDQLMGAVGKDELRGNGGLADQINTETNSVEGFLNNPNLLHD